MAGSDAGWVMTEDEWRDEAAMLGRIVEIVGTARSAEHAKASARAQAMPHATLDGMAAATLAQYASAYPRQSVAAKPLSPRRVRDALGYRPWRAPFASAAVVRASEPLRVRLARCAMRLRRTAFGTWLYELLPAPMLDALKARLR